MVKLWKWYYDCGRMGCLEGMFIATEKDVDTVKGVVLYLDDVLGKHSEIILTIDETDLEIVKISNESVETMYSVFGHCVCGEDVLGLAQESFMDDSDEEESFMDDSDEEES